MATHTARKANTSILASVVSEVVDNVDFGTLDLYENRTSLSCEMNIKKTKP